MTTTLHPPQNSPVSRNNHKYDNLPVNDDSGTSSSNINEKNNNKNWKSSNNTPHFLPSLLLFICVVVLMMIANQDRWSSLSEPYLRTSYGSVDNHTATERCLSMDPGEEMEKAIADANQIFIMTPPKNAGTTMQTFMGFCDFPGMMDDMDMVRVRVDDMPALQELRDQEHGGAEEWENYFTFQLNVPGVISQHTINSDELTSYIQNANSKTLIIYIHRDETERLKSGIRYVAQARLCNGRVSNNECIVPEQTLIDEVKKGHNEIVGAGKLLSCETYDSIEQNAPNMIFMHYTQVDKLQNLIAKYFCPELLPELPLKLNEASTLKLPDTTFVNLLQTEGEEEQLIELDDWLDAKINSIEWALQLNNEATCQAKTKYMQDELFGCPDQAIRVPYREGFW